MTKKILVLVGPSGSGKTTIGNLLAEKGIPKLITTTTRTPRTGEVDGIDYYFKNPNQLNAEDFVEQTLYNGSIYGLTRKEIESKLEQAEVVHVVMDQNGAQALKRFFPEETCVIFIEMSAEQLIERLRARGETEAFIKERLAHGEEVGEYQPPQCADYVIENHDLKTAVQEILQMVKK